MILFPSAFIAFRPGNFCCSGFLWPKGTIWIHSCNKQMLFLISYCSLLRKISCKCKRLKQSRLCLTQNGSTHVNVPLDLNCLSSLWAIEKQFVVPRGPALMTANFGKHDSVSQCNCKMVNMFYEISRLIRILLIYPKQ